MRNSIAFRFGLAALMAGALYAGTALGRAPAAPTLTSKGKTTALHAPAFLQAAHAAGNGVGNADVLARIDEEAGISAYFKAPDAITLSLVRTAFRTVEVETADYILGSVAVPGYPEHYDVHVYVHKTGWILAYYLRPDPVSKIIDLIHGTVNVIGTTKLKTVVAAVASAAGAPFGDVTYYDFRYPSATHMLLVTEDVGNGNSFTIKLPSSYGYFERGWGYVDDCCGTYFYVDGLLNPGWITGDCCYYGYGKMTASDLLPDVTHTISTDYYAVLVIVYRIP